MECWVRGWGGEEIKEKLHKYIIIMDVVKKSIVGGGGG